jgi:putative transposase
MTLSDAKKLKSLEQENSRLKKLVANLSLDKVMLEELLSKSF